MSNFWKNLPKPFLILAPMEGVTDFVFREIVCDLAKPDVLFTEFTNADGLFSKGKEATIHRLDFSSKQHPVVAQIWGKNPITYEKAAKLVVDLGFDGIDINMGCPDKSVMKNGSGAALIKAQDTAESLIEAIKAGVDNKIAVSVKTRLGIDKIITEDWISFLLQQNIDALTVHARIAKNGSKDPANWKEISKVVSIRNNIAPDTLIIGNGDVLDYQDALEKHKKYNVEGLMIGRGILANPWVFDKTQSTHTLKENMDLLLKHTKLYIDTWGSSRDFEAMKKYFKIYIKDFPGASELRQKLMLCHSYEQVFAVISSYGP